MPVIFAGHGSPMNAIEENPWSRGFASLRTRAPEPKGIVAISAHWFVDGTLVTSNRAPPTLHDFGGFPSELYEVEYPAPGDPGLAERVRFLLGEERAALCEDWGLDHGTWSVLRWMFPEAEVPVVQLSIDRRLEAKGHYDLGRSLAPLRDEGVLILGSGNVVHNLHDAARRRQSAVPETPEWARCFDEIVREAVTGRDAKTLIELCPGSPSAWVAHPSLEHWFPLLYAYGASDAHDPVHIPIEGFDWGSIAMTSFVFGERALD